jgi:hypothetical protein
MTGFDRRTVIATAAMTGAALTVPGALWAGKPRAGVFVVDRRFAASEAVALDRVGLGAIVIDPREEDLGIAWRQRIPQWLERNGRVMEGVTLWSDLFICQTFARSHGLVVVRSPQPVPSALADELQHWMLA